MRFYERFGGVVGLAFFFCYGFAMSLLVVWHVLGTTADEPKVVDVNGNVVDVPPYTPAEERGMKVYRDQVCWHCHSQFVRAVNQEDRRFGPVSQPGESARDTPHLFGTRRIGPDLAREGGLRSDDWQLAHLWNPRATVGASVMPGFTWLFRDRPQKGEVEALLALYDYDQDGVISTLDDVIAPRPADAALVDRMKGVDTLGLPASLYKQSDKGDDLKAAEGGARPYKDVFTQVKDADGRPSEVGDGLVSDRDASPVPTAEAHDVVAYLQRLGTAIGPWRQPLAAPTPQRPVQSNPPKKGVKVEWTDSAGQTQTTDVPDGRMPRRERKRRLGGDARAKASAEAVRAAQDLELEYAAVMAAWRKANPAWDVRLNEGRTLFVEHCAPCHGEEGRGNGLGAPFLNPRPRDFTQSAFRYRHTQAGNLPLHGDLYRTIWRGLPGSAMPPFRWLGDDNLWYLVDYVEHFLETIDGDAKEFDDQAGMLTIPNVPRVSDEQLTALIRRGKAVYSAAKCSNCHGTEGRADGPSWNTNMDVGGVMRPRDLKPRHPGDQPALRIRGGVFPQELYRTIFTGLGGTGMATSLTDFQGGWAEAQKLDALIAAKAPQDQIDAQAKAARRALIVPLYEDDLLADHGVIREQGAGGQTVEYLDRLRQTGKGQVGDDWALIFYVLDLMGARDLIPVTNQDE
jgi:cbb3-type cytochrome c oxidase subunit II